MASSREPPVGLGRSKLWYPRARFRHSIEVHFDERGLRGSPTTTSRRPAPVRFVRPADCWRSANCCLGLDCDGQARSERHRCARGGRRRCGSGAAGNVLTASAGTRPELQSGRRCVSRRRAGHVHRTNVSLEGLPARCAAVVRCASLRSAAIPSRRSRCDSLERQPGCVTAGHDLATHRTPRPVATGPRRGCCGTRTRRLTSYLDSSGQEKSKTVEKILSLNATKGSFVA